MIDHCVLKMKRQAKEKALETYVTDAFYAMTENTFYKIGIHGAVEAGRRLDKRWIEIRDDVAGKTAEKPEKEQEDERSCGEIAADMWARMRGRRR